MDSGDGSGAATTPAGAGMAGPGTTARPAAPGTGDAGNPGDEGWIPPGVTGGGGPAGASAGTAGPLTVVSCRARRRADGSGGSGPGAGPDTSGVAPLVPGWPGPGPLVTVPVGTLNLLVTGVIEPIGERIELSGATGAAMTGVVVAGLTTGGATVARVTGIVTDGDGWGGGGPSPGWLAWLDWPG
ncbi:MAG TPA: hypothetical protein VGS19_10295 [Streptosporangiaceae bacterium]|nr:hypothetical protein [Streptosporangiaceae bacterium]